MGGVSEELLGFSCKWLWWIEKADIKGFEHIKWRSSFLLSVIYFSGGAVQFFVVLTWLQSVPAPSGRGTPPEVVCGGLHTANT